MGITSTEKLAGLQLGDGAATPGLGTFMSVLEGADPEFNQELISKIPAGHTHPTYVQVNGKKIAIPTRCGQLAGLIAQLGNFGANTSISTLYYRKIENMDGPVPAATAEHTAFTANQMLSYIDSVTAGDRKEAMVSGRNIPVYDGTNETLIRVGNSAITPTPSIDQCYQLSSVVHPGGIVLENCDDWELNLNPEVIEESDESQKNTTYAAVHEIRPVMSFTTTDRSVFAYDGTQVLGFKAHLVRGKNLAECYLPNESQHIRCTIPRGVFVVQGKTSDSPSVYRCEVHAAGDESNGWIDNPVTWEINVTIDNT